ncbi:MAG TPA: GNAT family N-acetyltransferase [Dehalococcoidia bacterium]|nr:GNAT family N-acetyltransferase [Dehalococcoidia bacterium]
MPATTATTEIRPATPDEMPRLAQVVSLSLALPAQQFAALRPEWTLCAFENDQLATAYAAWPFTMRMNGKPMKVAGVTTVSTHPTHRRRGNLRAIMETDFRRRHEQGEPVAALYASLAAIYQRYGYAIVTTHHSYAIEPRYLQFTRPSEIPGELRESSPAELPTLIDVYRRFREQRTAYLHRGAAMWQVSALGPPAEGETVSVVLYEERGVPQGYVVYATAQGPADGNRPSQRLQLRDLCWLNPAAYRACWEHLSRFDLVRQISWPNVPADDPLPHLLLEPRMLHAASRDGILARIIDIDRAFAGRGYQHSGRLSFAATDSLCPWNEGTWTLEVDGADASVRRGGGTALFSAPIDTLSMLLFGQLSATEAWRMGRLDCPDPDALAGADRLLSTAYRPFCADHF